MYVDVFHKNNYCTYMYQPGVYSEYAVTTHAKSKFVCDKSVKYPLISAKDVVSLIHDNVCYIHCKLLFFTHSTKIKYTSKL